MDSIPIICLSGQVPTHLIGTDAFQEADTTGISRPCTKHNYLVKNADKLCEIIHKSFEIASSGRPGPVLIDLPKDIQLTNVKYLNKVNKVKKVSNYQSNIDQDLINKVTKLLLLADRPIIYAGGGVVNSGPKASKLLTELVNLLDCPVTLTLMGLGCVPNTNKNFLGMLGMHGTYEANLAKFASYVPCIPNIPKKFLFVFGTQPKPIRVSVTGQSNKFTNSVKSLDAFGPELTTPPPAYIIGRSASKSNFVTLLIKS